MKRLEVVTVLFVLVTTVFAITNKDKEQKESSLNKDVQRNEFISGRDKKKNDDIASESKHTRSFSTSPFHRTSFISRHGGYGFGIGVGLGHSHKSGAAYTPSEGSQYHVSGNGYSYGHPGEYPPPNAPPLDHRGAGPLPGAYDDRNYGSAYPHASPGLPGGYDETGLTYAGHYPPSGHGGHIGPPIGGPGVPHPPAGHGIFNHGGHLSPHHKLALKSILIPLAGVAVLGAAAALSSAHPILLQLGVAGKRKRRELFRKHPHFHPSFIK